MFSHVWDGVMHLFLGKNAKGISYVLLAHHIKRSYIIVLIYCLITGDVDFHRLLKVVSAGFLHCKVTIFLL